jgi:hypothetical protein
METLTSKQRRDKVTNKGQQDEEEEREIIKVYDGNVTYRNGTPRTISVPKQASYTQILVCYIKIFYLINQKISSGSRTSHIPYQ